MGKYQHLDHDYELEERPVDFLSHFWDTVDILGGWKVFIMSLFRM